MAKNKLKIYLLFFLKILITNLIIGQLDDYEVANFSVEEGLPSNECHDIVQDSLGYVWIATDRGLSRFDGYGFKNYGKKEGLGDLSCLKLFLDSQNNIWISTFGKRIYKYISSSDTIIQYKYNHLLEPHYSKSSFNFMYYFDKSENAYFGIDRTGIVKITKDGKVILPDTITIQSNQFYSYEVDEKFMVGISRSIKTKKKVKLNVGFLLSSSSINHKGKEFHIKYNVNQKTFGNARALKYTDSDYFYCLQGHHYFFKDQTLVKTKIGNEINDILVLENGWILTAQIFRQGVKKYKNNEDFMNEKSLTFINNISASRLFKDNQNNLFICTIEEGFYFLKKKSIQSVDLSVYVESLVSKLVKKDSVNLFLLLDENKILVHNLLNKNQTLIHTAVGNILDIAYNRRFNELYVAGNTSWIISKPEIKKKPLGYCGDLYKNMMAFNRYIPTKNKFLALSYEFFGLYADMNKPPVFCSEGVFPRKRFISGADYKNDSYLLGGLDGLFVFNGNTLVKFDSIQPIFRSRINDIKTFNGKYFLATLGKGLGIWDGDGKIITIQKSDGILTDNIERIFVDDYQNIYLCSKVGLSKITFISDQKFKIQNFTHHHGLSSNIVNDIIQMGDSLYIATAKGLCVMPLDLLKQNSVVKPIIEQMMVNNIIHKFNNLSTTFSYNENNITFLYKSLDYSLSGDITYRIRINQAPWFETKSTSINYASLTPGDYTFQVQSMNKDLEWSYPTIHIFKINKPWWESMYLKITIILLISFLGFIIYKNRIRKINESNRIKNEISKLERSALQAQMNPHFIFNCLNSIQNYIMRNDKGMAMEYLTKFARLIRQYLNASNIEFVTLEDEISMLDNYLKLEQMRFNQNFTYTFEINPDIDVTSLIIPPMLIQPFAENAVLHGLSSIASGGLINLKFDQKSELLHIIIKDNGRGFKSSSPDKLRSSLGVSITQKRLQYINDNSESNYNITTKSDANGTEINIYIKIA